MESPKNPIEIMAPVGSFPALQAALQAGADAVYFGVGQLNMRARAAVNFQPEDLHEIARICREHGTRTYLTLNTVVYDNELEECYRVLDLAKDAGICAVISSDWAVISYARKIGVEVHISTQCNVTNIEAVRFYAQYADVMVAARELRTENITDGSVESAEYISFIKVAFIVGTINNKREGADALVVIVRSHGAETAVGDIESHLVEVYRCFFTKIETLSQVEIIVVIARYEVTALVRVKDRGFSCSDKLVLIAVELSEEMLRI